MSEQASAAAAETIELQCQRPANLMEVCGTHSHAIARHGVKQLLPEGVRMLSGPGCPVCVTPTSVIDLAIEIARRHDDAIIATFGDMIKVPGSRSSLSEQRSRGRDVTVVYSPIEAVELARQQQDRQVVFIGVGFETTAPMVAAAIRQAESDNIDNFSVIVAHKLIPPAMRAIMNDDDVKIDGFLCPGHVATVIGSAVFAQFAEECGVPCVVAGFELNDILRGLNELLARVEDRINEGHNEYTRCVTDRGNPAAQETMWSVYQKADTQWRGLGTIPESGLELNGEYRRFDARKRFDVELPAAEDNPACACGDVLRGVVRPDECTLFADTCTPQSPVGPCMVSSEGACAAAYRYAR